MVGGRGRVVAGSIIVELRGLARVNKQQAQEIM